MAIDTGITTTRLKEMGSFLQTRRARLSPDAVGLPSGVRRRTPGLRREEVAQLSGVGLTWYTWLEQGRDIHASSAVLCQIARALRLDPAERIHLLQLAGHQAPAGFADDGVRDEERRVLARWEPYPAYIINRRWDVLAWNRATNLLFSYDEIPEGRRNGLWSMFLVPSRRALCVDWQAASARMVATFRAEAGQYLDRPEFQVLIAELESESPEFAALWQRRDVSGRAHGLKQMSHPRLGRLDFQHAAYEVSDQPGCKLILYTPADRRTETVLDGLDLDALTDARSAEAIAF
ncbi:MAG TPA: helix-turn-helix transcriptional regulator [Candidatus Dormibacteraeota bacterium]|jgi:transcriptional regulator with XRE-family HTH domain|nr:helix-turn-helix transcriptional regulator [Candidatus Dormibacteraeota bacterium]